MAIRTCSLANGHIYPQVDEDPSLGERYRQRNQLLQNDQGLFEEISDRAGEVFEIEESSRGSAWLDLENDGDLDIVVSNQDARPTLMENVTSTQGHWIQVGVPLGAVARFEVEGIPRCGKPCPGVATRRRTILVCTSGSGVQPLSTDWRSPGLGIAARYS